jgi:hypothetical protein
MHDAAASGRDVLTPAVKAALKDFIANVAEHSQKQSALVDVLSQALKSVNTDLQQQKLKTHLLEVKLEQAEAKIASLAGVVDALRRQGWLQ